MPACHCSRLLHTQLFRDGPQLRGKYDHPDAAKLSPEEIAKKVDYWQERLYLAKVTHGNHACFLGTAPDFWPLLQAKFEESKVALIDALEAFASAVEGARAAGTWAGSLNLWSESEGSTPSPAVLAMERVRSAALYVIHCTSPDVSLAHKKVRYWVGILEVRRSFNSYITLSL